MPTLHIFNPDNDYALASDNEYYTPPGQVIKLRRKLALLPALYAQEGDAILLLDEPLVKLSSLDYYDKVCEKGIRIITPGNLQNLKERIFSFNIRPWGWNRALKKHILFHIGRMKGIPDNETLRNIRNLSHRRTASELLTVMGSLLSDEITIPKELTRIEEAVEEFSKNKKLFFKAPWSSSGRGLMLTDDLEIKHLIPWVRGIIRRQGSVMVEKAYERKFDFASEWMIQNSKPLFLGYSIFNVSRRGKYHGNLNETQSNIKKIIKNNAENWNDQFLELQHNAIAKVIANHYEGPLGIDMLVTQSGAINPCVEINLRQTMGMIGLL